MNKFLLVLEFEASNNKKYKVKVDIYNNVVYDKEVGKHLLELYYLVA